MALEDVPAQEVAVRQLTGALKKDRIAHAYLFVGPVGVGKERLARELASVLLCHEPRDSTAPCGDCRSCTLFQAESHPDYIKLGLPEGRQSIPIALIRDLQDRMALKPREAPRRVCVITQIETMSMAAFNCFLKTLEEPPGAAVFALVASSVRDIPDTVVSRCQVVRLQNFPQKEVEEKLESTGLSARDAAWLARRSWGSPGLAEADRERNLHGFNQEMVDRLKSLELSDNFDLTEWVQEEAKERGETRAETRRIMQDLLECAVIYYRDLVAMAAAGDAVALNNEDFRSESPETLSPERLPELIEKAELAFEAIDRIDCNANQTLALDDFFTRLAMA